MKPFLSTSRKLLPLLSLAALCLAEPVFAQRAEETSPQPVGIERVDTFRYLVRISNPALQKARLQLVRLSDSVVLYEENSASATFGQQLNVQSLPDGQYAIVVRVGPEQYRYTLQLQTETHRTTDLSTASVVLRPTNKLR
jgi:hypothetical protein